MHLSKYFGSGLKRLFSGMALSRVSGLGRDLVMAYCFGDHPAVGAFIVAFRLANILRRFFGEGPLQSAFIPQFEGMREKDQEEAYLFFRKLTLLIGGVVLGIILILEGGITWWRGFEVVHLTGWMLPSLFFISLYGLNVSFLQCHNRFFTASMAPAICNSIWIIGALSAYHLEMHEAMVVLARWVLLGFALQWGATAWQVRKYLGARRWFKGKLLHSGVRELAKAFSLGALGVGAMQINVFFDSLFSRWAHPSGPVYLWYANRFQQLALAVFGIAAVNTLVPVLSRALKKGDLKRGKEIFSFGCQKVILLMVPMTFAVCILGFSALNLVFGWGSFTPHAVQQTAFCLSAYALGLFPVTLIMYHAAILYAQGNFKTSAILSLLTTGLSVGLNTLFIFGFGWGPIATALATSLSAWVNFFALRSFLKDWDMGMDNFIPALLGSGAATLAAYLTQPLFSDKLLAFLIPGTAFVAVYFLLLRKRLLDEGSHGMALSID